ncbi:MAG: sugar ABC transporter ATP-binding protein [Propionibacteriaceae bacterium]|jgi:ABC-type sugar transport system ATPase subunit|nr:sugar ABC transporter ATP-binding protein [Propionibacteriaceae bacterium]
MGAGSEPRAAFRTEKLTKRFSGQTAVDEVDLTINAGEVHGIIGRNGAGKTVLVSMMAGVLPPTSGTLVVGEFRGGAGSYSPGTAHSLGVTIIPQEPEFALEMSVIDNLFLGVPLKKGPVLAHAKMREVAAAALDAVGVQLDPRTKIALCTLEEQQLLALAKALFIEDAKVILLDEITASLSAARKQQILDLMRVEAEQNGRAFVLISHRISEVITVCDRVSVLRDGKRIATVPSAETTAAELAQLIVGDDVHAPVLDETMEFGDRVLQVEGLSKAGAFEDVAFSLRRGEVLGLAGLDGSGKDEVVNALYGLVRADRGNVTVNGKTARVKSPGMARKLGVAYVPKKREELAVVHGMSVQDNILLPVYSAISNAVGLINRRRAKELVEARMAVLPFKARSLGVNIDYLSGGNRQRVVINRMALLRPDVFVLHEPTRGVDIASKPDIIATVRNDLRAGSGVILTSESEDELVDMCDRVLVFFRGKCVREFIRGAADFTSGAIYNSLQGVEQ